MQQLDSPNGTPQNGNSEESGFAVEQAVIGANEAHLQLPLSATVCNNQAGACQISAKTIH